MAKIALIPQSYCCCEEEKATKMEINLEKLAFNLDFHPLENLVSAALVNGDLLLYRFSSDFAPQKVSEVHAHTKSCRAVRFIDDGRAIVMGPPNRLIPATDVETGGTIARLEDAHGEAINKIINLHQSKIASGDDGGCIKVWDTRQRSCCGTCQAHEDYVSDMTFVPDAMKLLGTSVDETLSVCNLRKETKVQARSEFSEEQLISVVLVKVSKMAECLRRENWYMIISRLNQSPYILYTVEREYMVIGNEEKGFVLSTALLAIVLLYITLLVDH